MNFIAIIGIVEKKKEICDGSESLVTIKIEKPFVESNDENWYDTVDVEIDNELFKSEIKQMEEGTIIGVKGRVKNVDGLLHLVGERIQVFN